MFSSFYLYLFKLLYEKYTSTAKNGKRINITIKGFIFNACEKVFISLEYINVPKLHCKLSIKIAQNLIKQVK